MSNDPQPLNTLAAEINARLEWTGRTHQKAKDHRIAAGLLLDEARRRVQAGEAGKLTWSDWLIANIHRSAGDVRKLIRHANENGSQEAAPSRRPSTKAATRAHHSLPRPNVIERAGGDETLVLHQLALREGALRALARASKEAHDIIAAMNRVAVARGLAADDFKHLDTAIAAANTATEIAREGVRSFVRDTSCRLFCSSDVGMLALEKPKRKALPPTVPNEAIDAAFAPKSRVPVRSAEQPRCTAGVMHGGNRP